MAGMTGNTLKQAAGVGAPVENRERERWLQRIRREEQAHKPFRDKAAEAMREYESKNREDTNQPVLYPIFWANTQITSAAIFNRLPKPEVRRRYAKPPAQNPQPGPEQGGAQPVPQTMGNSDSQIAMAIERCIEYQLDMGPYSDHWTRAVTEFLVAGLGVDLHGHHNRQRDTGAQQAHPLHDLSRYCTRSEAENGAASTSRPG